MSDTQTTLSFKYDHNGIRSSKTVNGTKTAYTYVGTTLISQKTGDEVINFAYTNSGAPYGFTYNGASYFYLLNLQGDVIGIYDSTGTVVVKYAYDAWGKLISTTGSLASTIGVKNPIRYRSYYYDTETGLYYLQSRYYDPETCCFINADSLLIAGDYLQGTNMFAYCLNNPVMYVDPTGMVSTEDAIYISVGIVSALMIFEKYLPIEVIVGFINSLNEANIPNGRQYVDKMLDLAMILEGYIEPIASGGDYVAGAGWSQYESGIYRLGISETDFLYLFMNEENGENIIDFQTASNNAYNSIWKYFREFLAGGLLTMASIAYPALLTTSIPLLVSDYDDYTDATKVYIVEAESIFNYLKNWG